MEGCHYCGGRLEQRRVEYAGRWRKSGRWVLIRDVPARVCTQCGEEFFDSDVAAALTRALKEGAEGGGKTEPMMVRELPPAMSGRL